MHGAVTIGLVGLAFYIGRRTAQPKEASRGPIIIDVPVPTPVPGELGPLPDLVPDPEPEPAVVPVLGTAASSGYDQWVAVGAGTLPGTQMVPSGNPWDNLGFDVDVFPAGADRSQIQPPSNSTTAVVGPGCSIIAIGTDMWTALAAMAATNQAAGASDVFANTRLIMNAQFPSCMPPTTEAAIKFTAELQQLVHKVIAGQPISNPGRRARRRRRR